MSRGFGIVLLLAGSGVLLYDSLATEGHGSLGFAILLLLVMASGLLLDSGEEDRP